MGLLNANIRGIGKIRDKSRQRNDHPMGKWNKGFKDRNTIKWLNFSRWLVMKSLLELKQKNVRILRITGLSGASVENSRKLSGWDGDKMPSYQKAVNSFLGNRNLYLLMDTWENFCKCASSLHTAKIGLIREFKKMV